MKIESLVQTKDLRRDKTVLERRREKLQRSEFLGIRRHHPLSVEECENTSLVTNFAQIQVTIFEV